MSNPSYKNGDWLHCPKSKKAKTETGYSVPNPNGVCHFDLLTWTVLPLQKLPARFWSDGARRAGLGALLKIAVTARFARPVRRETGTGFCVPNASNPNLADPPSVDAVACPGFAPCRILLARAFAEFSCSRVSPSTTCCSTVPSGASPLRHFHPRGCRPSATCCSTVPVFTYHAPR